MGEAEHEVFNDTLCLILSSIPKLAEFIVGHGINANVGRREKMHGKLLGPFGIDNMNRKKRNLLGLFLTNGLKVIKSFLTNLRILHGAHLAVRTLHTC